MTDTEMLDWLEAFTRQERVLVLHMGDEGLRLGLFAGLGMEPGGLKRTLREAIMSCAGVARHKEGK
jgi:hypothetical protein